MKRIFSATAWMKLAGDCVFDVSIHSPQDEGLVQLDREPKIAVRVERVGQMNLKDKLAVLVRLAPKP